MATPWFKQLQARLAARSQDAERSDARLAVAVLLHEVAHADHEHSPLEGRQVLDEIGSAFSLSPAAAEELRRLAAEQAAKTVSLHQVLDTLNAQWDVDQKRDLLARLWRVAWADGTLDPHEEALIRRLSDLLHLPHAAFVQERLRAAATFGGETRDSVG